MEDDNDTKDDLTDLKDLSDFVHEENDDDDQFDGGGFDASEDGENPYAGAFDGDGDDDFEPDSEPTSTSGSSIETMTEEEVTSLFEMDQMESEERHLQ